MVAGIWPYRRGSPAVLYHGFCEEHDLDCEVLLNIVASKHGIRPVIMRFKDATSGRDRRR